MYIAVTQYIVIDFIVIAVNGGKILKTRKFTYVVRNFDTVMDKMLKCGFALQLF